MERNGMKRSHCAPFAPGHQRPVRYAVNLGSVALLAHVPRAHAREARRLDELLQRRADVGHAQRADGGDELLLELEAAAGVEVAVDDAEQRVVLREAVLIRQL